MREGVVLLRAGDAAEEKTLVGYLLVDDPASFHLEPLRDFLTERLPNYMVPGAFGVLEAWPLTANGKLDRHALPDPEALDRAKRDTLIVPRSPEKIVAELWSELLGCQNFGVHESFFDLGGHSLLATRAVARPRQSLRVELPLSALFNHPTVAAMAAHIEQLWKSQATPELPPLVEFGAIRSIDPQAVVSIDPRLDPAARYTATSAPRVIPGGSYENEARLARFACQS